MMRMRTAVFLSLLSILTQCLGPSSVRSQVKINELYYDHPGSDSGWEFVELFNAGPAAVDLAGYALELIDGLSGSVRTLWVGSGEVIIPPGAVILISGGNIPSGSGLELSGSIENGPDAVRLVSGGGPADLVGYGDCIYSEGEPAEDVPAGLSLSRRPDGKDTGSNTDDFVPATPTPGERNFFDIDLGLSVIDGSILPCAGGTIPLGVSIENRGIEMFRGSFSVSARIEGDAHYDDRTIGPVELGAGAEVTLELILGAAPAGSSILTALVDTPDDQNRGNDTVSVTVVSSPGAVIINEIMYRPASGGSEWIELFCRNQQACSLSGWSICDATGTKRLIAGGESAIEPRGYCVLAQDTALFRLDHPGCRADVFGLDGGWPWLNDSDSGDIADIVELRNDQGVLIERIEYRDLLDEERGRSIERFSSDVCSGYPGGLWHRCIDHAGSTPGSGNSTGSVQSPSVSALGIDPNPFDPETHGTVAISGRVTDDESGFFVRIFSIDGMEIIRLFAEEGGARVFSCRWDGRDREGAIVATGLYICVVEYVRMGGGVCRKEKRGIAIYGEGR